MILDENLFEEHELPKRDLEKLKREYHRRFTTYKDRDGNVWVKDGGKMTGPDGETHIAMRDDRGVQWFPKKEVDEMSVTYTKSLSEDKRWDKKESGNLVEYKWKPSKTARREFAQKMNEIDEFCKQNGISQSSSSDSYYFTINGQKYRVSNHTVAASNRNAYDELGNKRRDLYHPDGEEEDVVYITAGKTRLIDIYNDLKNGYKLDRRGNKIVDKDTGKYIVESKCQVKYKHLIEDTFKQNEAIKTKRPRYFAKEVDGKGYVYDRKFSTKVPSNVDKDIATARASVKRWNREEPDWIENPIKKSLMQDIQVDRAWVKNEFGQEIYDALEEYTAKGNDLDKVLYSEDGWDAFEEFCKNKGIKIVPKSNPFVSQLTESVTESFEDEHLGTKSESPTPQLGPEAGLATIINSLITDEWEAIQGYNDAIVAAETEGYQDIVQVLRDIVNEENLHVGQLQTCMEKLSPNAELINQGEEEAQEQLNESLSEFDISKYTNDPETTVTQLGDTQIIVELSENDEKNINLINALKKYGFEQKSSFRFIMYI